MTTPVADCLEEAAIAWFTFTRLERPPEPRSSTDNTGWIRVWPPPINLGPAAIRAASTGRTRNRTRPMLQQRQKVLAMAPSTRDPRR